MTDTDARIAALATHLEVDPEEILQAPWGECTFACGTSDYLVLTDEEADERAKDYILESLWAFNAEFLQHYMPEGIDAKEIEAIRGDRCEDANPAMLALVKATDSYEQLVEDAIAADGRGHFLSHYDGAEFENEDASLFIYRLN